LSNAVAALFSVGGCVENLGAERLRVFLDLLAASNVSRVVVVGDFLCPASIEFLKSVAGIGVSVYTVTGRMDDTYIVRLLGGNTVVLDGVLHYVGNGVYFAGVGGREPLMNITRLAGSRRLQKGEAVVVASYHPPHGFCDTGGLGAPMGLYEARRLWVSLAGEEVFMLHACGSCYCRGAVAANSRLRLLACLYSLVDGPPCIHVVKRSNSGFYVEHVCVNSS
jgi:hypothetical protein